MNLRPPKKLIQQKAEVERLDRAIATTMRINTCLPPAKAAKFDKITDNLMRKRQIAYFSYSQSASKWASRP